MSEITELKLNEQIKDESPLGKLLGGITDVEDLTNVALSKDYSQPIARTFLDEDVWYVRQVTRGKNKEPEIVKLFAAGQYITEADADLVTAVKAKFKSLNDKMKAAAIKLGIPVKQREKNNPAGLIATK